MPNNFYLGLLEGEACHVSGGVHQHIFEKSIMFNSFLSLQNLFPSSGLMNVDKLIFGAHTLNANIPFLLVISYEMVADIDVLCYSMLNQIVG
jgi:hypothetical protein